MVRIPSEISDRLIFRPSGDYLASASFDKTTKIGQLDNNGNVRVVRDLHLSSFLDFCQQLRTIQTIQRAGNITQALWHPLDQNILSLLGEEKLVEIWDVRGLSLSVSRPHSSFLRPHLASSEQQTEQFRKLIR
jgi:WD40 repeat protein